ncbi:hypothetical protein T11_11009 [Trichinella zimbabwensis]|uniref:Uncharacterized protein n=1 Tax=Trichinella zimbabwensis TaxID=268475 RepID=A0A0V1GTV3_9BILA|nr:hypothetical protein T11_11009 [Trichinella zimbabwensis]
MKDKNIRVNGKEALRTGDWSTAAPVPRFQTLAPDWSTGPDMSGHVQTSAFMLAQFNTVRITQNLKVDLITCSTLVSDVKLEEISPLHKLLRTSTIGESLKSKSGQKASSLEIPSRIVVR